MGSGVTVPRVTEEVTGVRVGSETRQAAVKGRSLEFSYGGCRSNWRAWGLECLIGAECRRCRQLGRSLRGTLKGQGWTKKGRGLELLDEGLALERRFERLEP